MTTEIDLFPPEDTLIKCKTPEGLCIEIDAMDVDEMMAEVYNGRKELSTQELLTGMCEKFKQRYGYGMSRRSMDVLIDVKTDILNRIKKNSLAQLSRASTTESNQEQTENLESSN